MNDESICKYLLDIKKLAARHQSGADLADVKQQLDLILHEVRMALSSNRNHQDEVWAKLLLGIEGYRSSMSDPKWLDVMAYARFRLKSRRNTLANLKKNG